MDNTLGVRLLTGEEVAEALAISRSAAYRLMRSGELACVRFGKSVRVRPEDLEKFVEGHCQKIPVSDDDE